MIDDLAEARRVIASRWSKWFDTQPTVKRRITEPQCEPPSISAANAITATWDDIGHAEKRASYVFLDGELAIGQREISIWKENPDAVFLVGVFRGASGAVYYTPGTHLKKGPEQSRKVRAETHDLVGRLQMLRDKLKKAYARWKSRIKSGGSRRGSALSISRNSIGQLVPSVVSATTQDLMSSLAFIREHCLFHSE
jgi:hypothetical protein